RHPRRKFRSPRQSRGRRPIKGKLFDNRRTSDEEIGDCPLPQNIVAERHQIISEIAQALASHERIDWQRRKATDIKRASARERLLRERPENSRALAMGLVFLSIRSFPPLLSHLRFSTDDRSVRRKTSETGKAEEVAGNLTGRMVIGQ